MNLDRLFWSSTKKITNVISLLSHVYLLDSDESTWRFCLLIFNLRKRSRKDLKRQCFLLDIRDCIKEWLLCCCCPSLSPSLLIGPWDVEYMSVVLFCYILDAMLCYVWKKLKIVDNKKKKRSQTCLKLGTDAKIWHQIWRSQYELKFCSLHDLSESLNDSHSFYSSILYCKAATDSFVTL